MNDDFKQAVEILVSNHYLTSIDGKLIVTNKFTRELAQISPTDLFKKEEPIKLPAEFPDIAAPIARITREVIPLNSKSKVPIPKAGEMSPLSKFIVECEVPTRIKGADGRFYWSNKYSKDAEKELLAILAKEYQYDILVAATRLYYKGGGMVEAISNFLVRGTWLTHYQEMEKALRGGTVNKHISETVDKQSGGAAIYEDR